MLLTRATGLDVAVKLAPHVLQAGTPTSSWATSSSSSATTARRWRAWEQAREVTGAKTVTGLADSGYFSDPEVLAYDEAGTGAFCPKPLTSGAKAEGRFGK